MAKELRRIVKKEFGNLRVGLKPDPAFLISVIKLEDIMYSLLNQYETGNPKEKIRIPRKAYVVKQYDTYAEGITKLKKAHKVVFSVKNNLEARVKDEKLFNTYQDSCTAIIYDGGYKFKIDMNSKDLLNLGKDFNESAIMVDYESNRDVELDRREDIYNRKLNEKEFLNHKGWDVLFGGDKRLKRKFADKVYKGKPKNHYACEFILKENAEKGELREIVLCNSANDSAAVGKYDINTTESARFVQYVIKK